MNPQTVWLAVVLLAAGTNYVVVKDYLRTKIETNIVTSAHDKGEYVLPDGTHIWLNAGSVLRYYGDLTGRRRVVHSAPPIWGCPIW